MQGTNPLTKYQQYHHKAVELRYAGERFEDITDKINAIGAKTFRPATVRAWFATGGYLEELYFEYASQENDRRRQHMRAELGKLTRRIPEKFDALLARKEIDALTLRTVTQLCKVLGIALDEKAGEDVLDEYFDRLEGEITNDDNAQGDTKPVN